MSALNCHEWSEKAFQACIARSQSIHPFGRNERHKAKNRRKLAERRGGGSYHEMSDKKPKKGKK